MAEFSYEINTTIGTLSESGDWKLELNLVSWNKRKPVYDIRKWHYDDYDTVDKMGKGVTMNEAELKALYEILKAKYEEE
jgi:hypothetical protein